MLSRLDLRGYAGDFTAALSVSALALPSEGDDASDPVAAVREIVADVRARGDAALRELTARFDGCEIDDLRVPTAEVRAALDAASPELRAALEYAARRDRRVPRGAADPDRRPRTERRPPP